MNLALTDPFILAQDYPEALTGKLSEYTVSSAIQYKLRIYNQDRATRLVFDSIAEGISLLQAEYVSTPTYSGQQH